MPRPAPAPAPAVPEPRALAPSQPGVATALTDTLATPPPPRQPGPAQTSTSALVSAAPPFGARAPAGRLALALSRGPARWAIAGAVLGGATLVVILAGAFALRRGEQPAAPAPASAAPSGAPSASSASPPASATPLVEAAPSPQRSDSPVAVEELPMEPPGRSGATGTKRAPAKPPARPAPRQPGKRSALPAKPW
jgi:hypothetical protein